jgi:hypothetical protein
MNNIFPPGPGGEKEEERAFFSVGASIAVSVGKVAMKTMAACFFLCVGLWGEAKAASADACYTGWAGR